MRGFTLIEVLLAMALLAILFGVGTSLLSQAYGDFSLYTEEKRFADVLRRAEYLAFSNQGGSSHGVSLQADSFVLFRGSSYAERDSRFDEMYGKPTNFSFVGPNEVVFSQISGFPVLASEWTLFRGTEQIGSVSVNEYGMVTW